MTMNPYLINKVIPGRRWVVKRCDACGKHVDLYRPQLQPWNEFKAEFDQETLDRAVQHEARWQQELRDQEQRKKKNGKANS